MILTIKLYYHTSYKISSGASSNCVRIFIFIRIKIINNISFYFPHLNFLINEMPQTIPEFTSLSISD